MSLGIGTGGTQSLPAFSRDFLTPAHAAGLLILAFAAIVAAWPFGLTSDYLNHLARNHIEAQIWFDPVLQRYYDLSLDVIPDLTMDMLVPWLSHLTGIYAAGAVTIWLAFILPPLAGLLIARNVHGRMTWLSLAGFLFAFNENMQWGFVNFVASTGLALLGFALWMRIDPRWLRTLVFAPFGVFLAFNHALGFLLFGYLVLLWELACYAHGERGGVRDFLARLATKDALAMVPGLTVLALATGGAEQLTHTGIISFDVFRNILTIGAGAAFFDPLLGFAVTLGFLVAVAIGIVFGLLRLDSRMAWICAGMLALVIAMPQSIFGIWGLHFRYPAVFAILVAASVEFAGVRTGRRAFAFAAIGSVLLVAVFANAVHHLSKTDTRTRELRSILAHLPVGALLLPARHDSADDPFALHSAALAVIERSAFVPNLFTNTSPVDVVPAMRRLHMPQARPLSEEQLVSAIDLDPPAAENGFWSKGYFNDWPNHWDHLIYFRTAPNQHLDVENLCPVAERANLVLYGIGKNRCNEPGELTVSFTLRPTLE
ncbi:hypothetical protein [Hoeflea sp.]|uniref:hypothetical protein n=1 Tax=Hoeflea sp. TaxID=1940281 RepID=UPI003B0216FD